MLGAHPALKRDGTKARRPLATTTTRASPNSASGFLTFTVSSFCLNDLSAHLVCHVEAKKVKDCGTTTGHVGLLARTLMKDARGGLIR